jgi:hypothetical protein
LRDRALGLCKFLPNDDHGEGNDHGENDANGGELEAGDLVIGT